MRGVLSIMAAHGSGFGREGASLEQHAISVVLEKMLLWDVRLDALQQGRSDQPHASMNEVCANTLLWDGVLG